MVVKWCGLIKFIYYSICQCWENRLRGKKSIAICSLKSNAFAVQALVLDIAKGREQNIINFTCFHSPFGKKKKKIALRRKSNSFGQSNYCCSYSRKRRFLCDKGTEGAHNIMLHSLLHALRCCARNRFLERKQLELVKLMKGASKEASVFFI